MKTKLILLSALGVSLLLASPLSAQSLSRAQQSIQDDLKAATEEYAALQAQIRDEKIPLSRELNRLERLAREKDRELRREERRRDTSQNSLIELNDKVQQIQENIDYMENLLNDFNRRFEASINIAEKQLYQDEIDVVKENAAANKDDTPYEATFTSQSDVLSSALDRVQDVIGGYTFSGKAIITGGAEKDGNFIITGPASFFAASDGAESGLVDRRQPTRAKIINIGFQPAISEAASSGTGILPQDPTLNDAVEMEVNKTTWEDEIRAGGVWVWPIIAFFVLSILIGIYKFFTIFAVSKPSESVIQEILTLVNDGKKDEAMTRAQSLKGPFGLLLVDAVTFSEDSRELLEEVLYERMLETQPRLESLLPFIAVTAATAPLLGLLGTVTGMINTFEQITLFGTSDASKLAGGISEALITTKYGLITAIPALILHALLARRAQGVMATMEKYSAAFINGLNNSQSE
jgi:biopolymer transport protein ExbB